MLPCCFYASLLGCCSVLLLTGCPIAAMLLIYWKSVLLSRCNYVALLILMLWCLRADMRPCCYLALVLSSFLIAVTQPYSCYAVLFPFMLHRGIHAALVQRCGFVTIPCAWVMISWPYWWHAELRPWGCLVIFTLPYSCHPTHFLSCCIAVISLPCHCYAVSMSLPCFLMLSYWLVTVILSHGFDVWL